MAGIAAVHPPSAAPQSAAAFCLPARLDMPAAAPLAVALRARRGAALRIDAGEVAHLGALCLQVLLAAAANWRADGVSLQVAPRSEAFAEALEIFAVAPGMVEAGTTSFVALETGPEAFADGQEEEDRAWA